MEERVTFEIIEAGDGIVWVSASGPWGIVELVGSFRFAARTVYLDGVHVGGAYAGRLGRAGINTIARKVLEELDADEIVIQGSVRTSGRNSGRAPRIFRFPHPKHPA